MKLGQVFLPASLPSLLPPFLPYGIWDWLLAGLSLRGQEDGCLPKVPLQEYGWIRGYSRNCVNNTSQWDPFFCSAGMNVD